MAYREMLIPLPAIVLLLSACAVQTPDEVNDSGNKSYMNSDYPAALNAYEGARERAPMSGELHYNVGNSMYRIEDFEGSLSEYDDALLYATGEVRLRAFFNRGNAAFRVREYAQAVEAYEEVLRMDPDHLDAKHNLELALKQLPPQGRDDEQSPPEAQPPQAQPPPEAQPPPQSEDDAQASPETQPPQAQPLQEMQTEPLTEEQARQALEAVGEDAKTLQEGRQQTLVSPKPPPEFPW